MFQIQINQIYDLKNSFIFCFALTFSYLSDKSSELLEGFQHSPYPDIDKFIKTCVKQGGVQGEIRRWLYFTQGQKLIYDISKNRWCGNIKRPHKSNNIM